MLPDASAEGTARPATALTIAAARTNRLNTYGLPSEGRQHATQALLEIDLGGPAEDLFRTRDVCWADLGIAQGQASKTISLFDPITFKTVSASSRIVNSLGLPRL